MTDDRPKLCEIQERCPKYDSGDSKPPNHHVRMSVPCVKSLNYSCDMDTQIRLWLGEEIACNLEKIRRLKGKE